MKGQVLGFDGTSGAITGEDGKRYRFTSADWRDARPAAAKDQVDFVAEDESAREIYRLKAAFAVAMPNGAALDGEPMARLKAYAARPQLVLALVLVLASLFLNFIESGTDNLPLTQVHRVYSALAAASQQQQALLGQTDDRPDFGHGPESINNEVNYMRQKAVRDDQAATDRAKVSILHALSYALWLVPLGAAIIVYCELRDRRRRGLELLVGAGAVLSLVYIPLTRYAVAHAMDGLMGSMLGAAANAISLGFGAFVIAAAGFGLLLTGTNRISRTPGL